MSINLPKYKDHYITFSTNGGYSFCGVARDIGKTDLFKIEDAVNINGTINQLLDLYIIIHNRRRNREKVELKNFEVKASSVKEGSIRIIDYEVWQVLGISSAARGGQASQKEDLARMARQVGLGNIADFLERVGTLDDLFKT